MQPWAQRLDARMLHMEAALLDAQHAMLSAAVHTSDKRHRASAQVGGGAAMCTYVEEGDAASCSIRRAVHACNRQRIVS